MLNFKDMAFTATGSYTMLGDLIPKNKVTLLHGKSGAGKTLSIIKYFENLDIEPVLIDFDDNISYSTRKILHLDGYKFLNYYLSDKTQEEVLDLLKGKVVIIDTYAKCNLALEEREVKLKTQDIATKLSDYGITVVVIAHSNIFAGKAPEPDTDNVFANHVACRLFLNYKIVKKKPEIQLIIEKLRNKPADIIENWMRD